MYFHSILQAILVINRRHNLNDDTNQISRTCYEIGPQEEVEYIGLLDVLVDAKLPTSLYIAYIWV